MCVNAFFPAYMLCGYLEKVAVFLLVNKEITGQLFGEIRPFDFFINYEIKFKLLLQE